MKTYYLKTLSVGCPKNMIESSTYRQLLDQNGYQETTRVADADIVVFNTCGCLQSLQDCASEAAYQVPSEKRVIVAGCYPLIDRDQTLREDGYHVVAPAQYSDFQKIIGENVQTISEAHHFNSEDYSSQPYIVKSFFQSYSLINRFLPAVAAVLNVKANNFLRSIMMTPDYYYITIGSGCLGGCTFCGIKRAIGKPKSIPLESILKSFREARNIGKNEIWLVSDDLGSWGHDTNQEPYELLEALLAFDYDFKLVLNFFEPDRFLRHPEKYIKLLSDRRIIQVCVPIQSNSQKVLKQMGRKYDVKRLLEAMREVRMVNPNLILKTQVIVGFPGETWGDFFSTLKAFVYFDGCGVNGFARLKHTPAFSMLQCKRWVIALRLFIARVLSAWMMLFVFLPHFRAFKAHPKPNAFWAEKDIIKRRSAFHPVVFDCVSKKIEILRKFLGTEQYTCHEIGAGDGHYSVQLDKIFDLTLSEPSEKMVENNPLKEKCVRESFPKIDRANASVDIVFEANVLHHLDEVDQAIAEMVRISKKYVVIIEPNRLNPLNFLLGVFVKNERNTLRYGKAYILKKAVSQNLILRKHITHGLLPLNSCPINLWKIFRFVDLTFPVFGLEHIYIFEKVGERARGNLLE